MRPLLLAVLFAVLAGCATTKTAATREEQPKIARAEQPPARQAPECAEPARRVPGGIADPERGVLLLRADDGIEAVELSTGATLWRATAVDRAIAVGGNYVVAATESETATNALRLALLDRSTGAMLSAGPELPIGAQLAEAVEPVGAMCGEGRAELSWSGLRARADLLQRTLIDGPTIGAPAGAPEAPARLNDLELRVVDRKLRAYAQDGALRWERKEGVRKTLGK